MEDMSNYMNQNITLPHDVIKLPSQGIFYKNKKKALKIGYLTASDENILLSNLENNNTEGLVTTLIRNKLYEPDINVDELLYGDIQAILIFLRNSSFGSSYTITSTDPKTSQKFTTDIDLSEINFKKLKNNPDENGFFTLKLPKSGLTVKLRILTIGDIQEIEQRSKSYPSGRVIPKQTWTLEKQIVEINGNNDRGYISSEVEKLPIMDSKEIRKFFKENEPGLDLNRTIIAPSGEKVNVNINFGVEFFRPFFEL